MPARFRIAFVAFAVATALLAPTVAAPPPAAAAPANDDLDNALVITDDYEAELDNTDATLEAGEVSGSCEFTTVDWSTWYRFNAPATGDVRVSTRLTAPNSTNYLEVFEITAVGPPTTLGSEVACESGQNFTVATASVTSGSDYAIRIAGAASDLGDMIELDFDTMGTISGTVTDEGTALPIEGITVQVLTSPTGGRLLGSATTDSNGDWTAAVPSADVLVQFAAGSSTYGLEYWDDVLTAALATTITVGTNEDIVAIDAALTDAGTVEVSVTSSLGGPLEGAQIALYEEPSGSLGGPIYQGSTEADGTKTFIGVVPGNYVARLDHPDHLDEWYDDAPFWDTATTIVVTAGNTTNVAAELAAGGKISGTVTDALGGPLPGAVVEAYRTSDGTLRYNDTTDENGAYEMAGLEPDTYAVRVQTDDLNGSHANEWWDDLPDSTGYAGADPIVVSAGSADVADFSLVASAVSGVVTSDADGLPIAGVEVTLRNDDDSVIDSTSTGADGSYGFEAFAFTGSGIYVGFDPGALLWQPENSPPQTFTAGNVIEIDASLAVVPVNPVITGGTAFSVSEAAPVGTTIGTVTATDANRADTLSFSITGGNTGGTFAMSTSGTLTTAAALDFETTESYSLTVQVSDLDGGSTSGTVTIDITDVQEDIPSAGFIDTIGTTFEKEIDWMAYTGITLGCNPPDNDRYCPDDNVTRGQMAAFIVRALDLPATSEDYFDDDDGSTFEDNINRLAAAGITRGCTTENPRLYCPGDTVTRGQMAAFIVRALGLTDDGGGNLFTDDDGSTFEADIDKLATAGITLGCNPPDNDNYCPADTITRGQMAAFLFRALAG